MYKFFEYLFRFALKEEQIKRKFNFLLFCMINNKFRNAPLILFCYNRLEPLKKVITSLRSDYQIQNTDVYIFSDGPKIDSLLDVSKVKEVRKYYTL